MTAFHGIVSELFLTSHSTYYKHIREDSGQTRAIVDNGRWAKTTTEWVQEKVGGWKEDIIDNGVTELRK